MVRLCVCSFSLSSSLRFLTWSLFLLHVDVVRCVCPHHCVSTSACFVLSRTVRKNTHKEARQLNPTSNIRCFWCFVLLPRLSVLLLPHLPFLVLPHFPYQLLPRLPKYFLRGACRESACTWQNTHHLICRISSVPQKHVLSHHEVKIFRNVVRMHYFCRPACSSTFMTLPQFIPA